MLMCAGLLRKVLCMAIVATVLATGFVAAQSSPEPGTIEASRIVLRDKEGRIRIEIAVDHDGTPFIMLYDPTTDYTVYIYNATDAEGVIELWGNSDYSSLYLSPRTFIPDIHAWTAMEMTAYENHSGFALTDKLNKEWLTARAIAAGEGNIRLRVKVGTQTQPSWDNHAGRGKFAVSDEEVRAAYKEAGDAVFEDIVLEYFPHLRRNEVEITFFINGYPVGTWVSGYMLLAGER